MKKLSDYQGNDAIELWADLIDPLSEILTDDSVKNTVRSGKPKLAIAKEILKSHSSQATEILLRIDDTPVNGLNIVLRLISLLTEIGQNDEIKSFFGYAEQTATAEKSSGSPMVNTEEDEK